MKKMLTALVAFAIVAFLSGCAGTPQEKAASVLVEMQMKKTNLIKKDHVPAGLGIGVSKDEQVVCITENDAQTDYADMITIWNGYFITVGIQKTEQIVEEDMELALRIVSDLWVVEK